ncbi:MAG: gamma-glutamyl-phosphate reductase [Gracilibacter sp. BRH_c7a]|nr:MAG: gamma-glutamyl-phosphate reductase [Gracilibacter sp. BRH_c7a]
MIISNDLILIGKKAKEAARKLAFTSTGAKNSALSAMAQALVDNQEEILSANSLDLQAAEEKGLRKSLINRLRLSPEAIMEMSNAIHEITKLPDPVGGGEFWTRPNGLRIQKTRVPLGVVAMIYEARPNVTVDAAVLCLKSGNACILRGGSEAIESNKALARIISDAVENSGLPQGSIQLIHKTEREYAAQLMRMNKYIDVIIPRGGEGLIKTVIENSTVPVIETGTGVCHAFVDKDADIAKAVSIVFNAKTQKPGVCNALETLLVHQDVAQNYLEIMGDKFKNGGVEIRGCDRVQDILDYAVPASEEDWGTEYLDLIISSKVVTDMEEALDHIYKYSTKHSEIIITENYSSAQRFLNEVDAAAVLVNASTRFTDGGRFGFGAEIGISTQKLHARGPMALPELTTIKYVIYGDGHIVE